jgi:hypothetical protein
LRNIPSERLTPFSVDEAFARAVVRAGGRLVRDLLPDHVDLPRNADYVFQQFDVIGELKRMEKDQGKDPSMAAKTLRMYERWVARGDLKPAPLGTIVRLNPRSLPPACARELISLYREPIAHRIKTADKQIKSTKTILRMESAMGLLFLAQDGDYSVGPADVLSLVARVLNGKNYSNINEVIYFNARPAVRRSDQSENMLWAPARRNGARAVPIELVSRLSAEWHAELEAAVGHPVTARSASSSVTDMEDFNFPKGRS